jgi:pectin methylesterase-like acyl-CoA thioesterase
MTVSPGQSIQAAVDRARPGDTIVVQPGTYAETVQVSKDDLTIRGAGATPQGSVLAAAPRTASFCSRNGRNGFCVIGSAQRPVRGGHVTGFLIQHLPGYGIIAFHADDVTVDNLVVRDNGGNGIASIFTHRFTIANVVASNNAGFGVDAGNTDRMAVTGVIARDNGYYGIGRRLCCSRLVSSTTDPRLDLVRVKQRRMNGVGVGRSLFRCRAVGSGFSLLGRP